MTARDREAALRLFHVCESDVTAAEIIDEIADAIATARREGAQAALEQIIPLRVSVLNLEGNLKRAQAEIARLRAVLVAVCECPHPRNCTDCSAAIHAALRGDWDAVRAAGVALEDK